MDVQFEEDKGYHYRSSVILGKPERPKILNLVMKLGIKDEKKAANILIGLVVVMALASIFFFTMAFNAPQANVDYPLF